MKSKWINIIAVMLVPCFFLISCVKNETKFYADKETNGLSIFSNTGDNVFTCYINNSPWRTIDRYSAGLFVGARSEIFLGNQSDSLSNTLVIQWQGNFIGNTAGIYDAIYLYLNVPSTFSYKDINNLQGKRLTIDSTTGYFSINIANAGNERGTGNIYFNTASLDSLNGQFTGRLSGLLEITSPSYKIISGRFDHELTPLQIRF